ncbi:MAG: cytidylate kinase-like family protein [Lachnospiraceae bacterium]|nr:cytidylate kinase-like family protein [Lachnospiraceae bacterium]MDD7148938.1 cytidylate kinase-like family protein [Lachnospiraceae bacterium]MDY4069183.1 cytidylate kinase-like family protein [Lachnospiraceae bacterium]
MSKNFVIAITRTCGSGATSISKQLADDLCIDLYDRKLLQLASDDSGINEALFAQADEHVKNSLLYRVSKKVYNGELIPPESDDFTSNDNLFNYQAKVLKELAEKESYICIGRAADYILRDNPNLITVFIYAPLEKCIDKEMDRLGINRKQAEKHILSTDKYRREYYKYHTGREWENPYNYDLCLNTGKLTYDQCVEVIKNYLHTRID